MKKKLMFSLLVKNYDEAIDFYTKALGARETMRFQIEDSIPHAEIMIGTSTIVLAEEWPEGGRFSAETLGQSPISIALEVEDVDAFAERAVASGLKMTARRGISSMAAAIAHSSIPSATPGGFIQSKRRCLLKRCIADSRPCRHERPQSPLSTRFPRAIAQ